MSVSVSSSRNTCLRDLGVSSGTRFRLAVASGASVRLVVALGETGLCPVAQRASTQTRRMTTTASYIIRQYALSKQ